VIGITSTARDCWAASSPGKDIVHHEGTKITKLKKSFYKKNNPKLRVLRVLRGEEQFGQIFARRTP
jgi:hypothetical protein